MKKILLLLLILSFSKTTAQPVTWKTIEKGLELGIFKTPVPSLYGDSQVYVLKISPKEFDFELVCGTENGKNMKTAQNWCAEKSLLGCINAGMFDGTDPAHPENKDFVNRGYTRNFAHTNSPTWTSDKSVIAFNRKDTTVPAFQLIDLQCQDINTLKNRYNTLIQGVRVVDCKQTIRWMKDNKLWGMSLLAMDKAGNMLWIHTYSPYAVYAFAEMLLKAPLNIANMIYLDGGTPAVFYLSDNGTTVYRRGSYPDSFSDKNFDRYKIVIPNVIGFRKKK